eukprot:m.189646 g.189646  ORF g.189646 m.189646 type:complete len:440 (+) comp17552_c0_seq1:3054-4373(+)
MFSAPTLHAHKSSACTMGFWLALRSTGSVGVGPGSAGMMVTTTQPPSPLLLSLLLRRVATTNAAIATKAAAAGAASKSAAAAKKQAAVVMSKREIAKRKQAAATALAAKQAAAAAKQQAAAARAATTASTAAANAAAQAAQEDARRLAAEQAQRNAEALLRGSKGSVKEAASATAVAQDAAETQELRHRVLSDFILKATWVQSPEKAMMRELVSKLPLEIVLPRLRHLQKGGTVAAANDGNSGKVVMEGSDLDELDDDDDADDEEEQEGDQGEIKEGKEGEVAISNSDATSSTSQTAQATSATESTPAPAQSTDTGAVAKRKAVRLRRIKLTHVYDYEWEVKPGLSQYGVGDLVLSNKDQTVFAAVEIKFFNFDATGRTASSKRNRQRSKVEDQARTYAMVLRDRLPHAQVVALAFCTDTLIGLKCSAGLHGLRWIDDF